MPAFMACQPHHPFYKLLISKLSEYISLAWKLPWNANILRSTGPQFVAEVLDIYQREHNNTGRDYIHLAPSEWFMPTFDSANLLAFQNQCGNVSLLTEPQASVCTMLKLRRFKNEVPDNAFTNHHWMHSWGSKFHSKQHISVEYMVPYIKIIK